MSSLVPPVAAFLIRTLLLFRRKTDTDDPEGISSLHDHDDQDTSSLSHDTAEFAVASIRQWWETMGQVAYPEARALFITADAGGSNGYRSRGWKQELQRFADDANLRIRVSHFPPGTSKWNKIEHRLFCHITQNWRGKPLCTFETLVALIANTRTPSGLRVNAALDTWTYEKGLVVPKTQMESLSLHPHDFHESGHLFKSEA